MYVCLLTITSFVFNYTEEISRGPVGVTRSYIGQKKNFAQALVSEFVLIEDNFFEVETSCCFG